MLAALPPLVPRLPAAGQQGARRAARRARPTRWRSRSSPPRCARDERLLAVVAADALAAQRLADELPWFAPGLARRAAARLGNAALRPLLAAPGPRLAAAGDALPRRRAANATCSSSPRRPRSTGSRRRSYLAAFTFFLKQGTRLDVDALRAQLALAGYQHVTQVVSPGEFSVRGGLIDLFPMGSALPYRLDLFGDDIESIKTFDVDTQRTLYPVPDVRLLPAREFPHGRGGAHALPQPLPRGLRGRSVALAAVQGRQQRRRARRHRVLPAAVLRRDRDARRLPAARTPPSRCVGDVAAAVERFWQDTDARYRLLRGDKARPLLPPTAVFLPPDAFNGALKAHARVEFPPRGAGPAGHAAIGRRRRRCPSVQVDRRADDPLAALKRYLAAGDARVLICAESAGRRETMQQYFAEYGLDVPLADDWRVVRRRRRRAARWSSRRSHAGLRVARRRSSRSSPRPSSTPASCAAAGATRRGASNVDAMLRDLSEVRIGDPVVHEQHGIGRYLGLVTMDLGEGPAEFLQLVYANDAKLYVPVANLHLIGRYSGASPEAAPLHELGSGQWDKAKKRAARQAHDTAAELLNLYAQRAARKGHAFGFKPHDYEAFADGFGFEETPDQQAAIEAVIKDLTDGQADGPARLRRRRLRQDRGRAARGVRRARRRQAGRGAGADHAARRAALPGVLRPLRRPAASSSPSCRASARRRR